MISGRRVARELVNGSRLLGIDPLTFVRSVQGLPFYLNDVITWVRQRQGTEERFPWGFPSPCLHDRFAAGGSAGGHYFHQDLLVAQRVFDRKPTTHVDIGSRVDGFVAHVASFREIHLLDLRPLPQRVRNVRFQQADLMADLDPGLHDYCDSLSCLHALEHFGLGRYGDPIRLDGYRAGLENIYRLLCQGGCLYLSVPIGPQRLEFNAHRVFSVGYLLELVRARYRIDAFSYVSDKGELFENVELSPAAVRDNFGCTYGCGILELTKR